jgi:bifunctional damage-control phosphatase, subfamily II, fusion protein
MLFYSSATAILELMKTGNFEFSVAKSKIGHCHLNQSEALVKRLTASPKYKKAVIFTDNSGADFILGIVPLARYLLSLGTRVILAANTYPSVNDITV